jgi:APA family basic amino acid/polyamine antiporter
VSQPDQPHLIRRFGLLQATALNVTNMIGIGPFITIPTMMATINGGGPQCILGWIASLLIVLPDGLIWAELSAAMPISGGSYVWLREGFGRETWGRLMAFLFIWQFIVSGPMEIGTGFVGIKQYVGFLFVHISPWEKNALNAGLGLLLYLLLYRRIDSIGKITVWLWIGTMITVCAVIAGGVMHFDRQIAFDFPPKAFNFSLGFLSGLGAAASIGVYDYLGYYDVCYIGEEVRDPGKVIPRSIILSLLGVAVIYLGMNFSIIGVVPWKTFVATPDIAIGSVFIQKIWGAKAAQLFTFLILWTAFGSIFTMTLGYSRVPYAAARDGLFFRVFDRLHPTKDFPHISLTMIVALSIAFSFFSLDTLINALLALRIIVQFIGQIGAVILLRRAKPDMPRPFRIWLYPLPALLALAGWCFLFLTTEAKLQWIALAALAVGIVAFLIWSRASHAWPFKRAA